MDVTATLAAVRERIAATGRAPDEVRIVAVTKGFGSEAVEAAVAAGVVDCGENFAQALVEKADAAPEAVRWHFLGPVQRNKVKALAPHVSLWHGIDREAAGAEVARRQTGAAVLVQVNLTGADDRPGCSWAELSALVARLWLLDLEVRGLMGVGSRDPVEARAQFRRLSKAAGDLGLPEVSMGMSGDLEVAVEEGATIVRIGTALFGARPGIPQARR